MLLNITILEDEAVYAGQLQKLLSEWGKKNNVTISVRHFSRGEDFIKKAYDEEELFFLDIDLVTTNGIEIAKELREDGFRGHIIFLTAFSEYVFDGYHVQALDYLLKPIDADKLDNCMKPVLKDMESSFLIWQTQSEMIKVPYNKIMAFTSYKHYVDIITQIPVSASDNTTCKCYRRKITLKALEQQLPKQFMRCHRTIIININKVMKLTRTEATLSDDSVYPVSESYLKNVREAFWKLLK